MTTTRYYIMSWASQFDGPPHPKATPDPDAADYQKPAWVADLTPEDVVGLSETNDVMIQGASTYNAGTRKKPHLVPVPPRIWLDEKGRSFRTR